VICLSSSAHRRSDIHYNDPCYDRRPYDPAEAYGQSKTANALFAVGFSVRFAGPHLTANAVMPGGIRTGLTRYLDEAEFLARGWIDAEGNDLRDDWKSPEQGAATTIWAAVAPELRGVSGKYLEDCAIARTQGVRVIDSISALTLSLPRRVLPRARVAASSSSPASGSGAPGETVTVAGPPRGSGRCRSTLAWRIRLGCRTRRQNDRPLLRAPPS
jgi:hypothetical protein